MSDQRETYIMLGRLDFLFSLLGNLEVLKVLTWSVVCFRDISPLAVIWSMNLREGRSKETRVR